MEQRTVTRTPLLKEQQLVAGVLVDDAPSVPNSGTSNPRYPDSLEFVFQPSSNER
jgi:hypothetical protein